MESLEFSAGIIEQRGTMTNLGCRRKRARFRASALGGWVLVLAGSLALTGLLTPRPEDRAWPGNGGNVDSGQVGQTDLKLAVRSVAFSAVDAHLASLTIEGDLWLDDLVTG